MEQIEQPTAGPVTLEDVREALGNTSPHQTNSATIRQRLGRGSLSTIQRHLAALRQQSAEQGHGATHGEIVAPEAPDGLLRGLWESAYAAALATVQNQLIAAHERIAELEGIERGHIEEIQAMAELVGQIEAERDQARSEATEARQAQRMAEAERDEALRLRDQITELTAMIATMKQGQ